MFCVHCKFDFCCFLFLNVAPGAAAWIRHACKCVQQHMVYVSGCITTGYARDASEFIRSKSLKTRTKTHEKTQPARVKPYDLFGITSEKTRYDIIATSVV